MPRSRAAAAKLVRILTIDVLTGTTHEYAYELTSGSGVSEICAISNHEFLTRLHTLWIANDNDFLLTTAENPAVQNPNQFFVIGFTDQDLPGFVPPTNGLPFGN